MSGALCNACLVEAKTQMHSNPEPAVYHGLCERHRSLPAGQYLSYDFYSFPRSQHISSAGQFFKTITTPSGRGSHPLADYEERMRPIVDLPFTVGPTADFVFDTFERILADLVTDTFWMFLADLVTKKLKDF